MLKKLKILVIIAILLALLTAAPLSGIFSTGQKADTRPALDKALDFLQRSQLESGEFRTYACADAAMEACFSDGSLFITTFVAYSLNEVEDPRADAMSRRALDFLAGYEEPGGIWRFWTETTDPMIAKSHGFGIYFDSEQLDSWVPPDFDDTSTVSAVLTLDNRQFGDNLGLFMEHRDGGAVYTWLVDRNDSGQMDQMEYYGLDPNETDLGVNANVLLYYAARGLTDSRVCSFVVDGVGSREFERCNYCQRTPEGINNLPLLYEVSRAYAEGASCLVPMNELVVGEALGSGFDSDLDLALRANTLMNFGYKGPEVERGIVALLARQRADGSWGRYPLIDSSGPYYGSEELTTALAIEALVKYQNS